MVTKSKRHSDGLALAIHLPLVISLSGTQVVDPVTTDPRTSGELEVNSAIVHRG
jgi:hypothetical protein